MFAITSFLALAEFKVFLWAIAVLGILDLIVLVFTHLGRGHLYSSFWLFLLQKISYAYVLQAWGVFALFDELLSTKMRWDKLERIGASPLRIG
ncbi:hypothetical protein KA005_59480 [bacterium]|nr:hypothetical protein [bacterium]